MFLARYEKNLLSILAISISCTKQFGLLDRAARSCGMVADFSAICMDMSTIFASLLRSCCFDWEVGINFLSIWLDSGKVTNTSLRTLLSCLELVWLATESLAISDS